MHPDQVGPYRIERKIGAGGMGNVYLGIHKVSGKTAAVKVLPPSMAREDGFVQRFHREIESLRKLSNKHIVELYEDGTTDDATFYYSMEYVDGSTLTTEITDRKRIPWKEVIEMSLQIASALKAAHDAGIVHRDLKPSNLLLTKDRMIKLTDFGVASLFATSRLTRTVVLLGQPNICRPNRLVDSDLQNAAICIHWAL
jgi:serine/threonine protein kinase